MTTPERLRRRQRIATTLFVVAGFLVICVGLFDSHQRDEQADDFKACLVDNFADLTDALTARANAADAKFKTIDDVVAGVSTSAQSDPSNIPEILRGYRDARAAQDAYSDANPIPPFPSGECEE